MFYHLLLFTNMFRSLQRLSSGCHTRIQTVYKQLHKMSNSLDITVNILSASCSHTMSNCVIIKNR